MLYAMEISERRLKIVFSSVLKNISEVMEDAIEFLNSSGHSYDSFSLKLAMAEGLTNAVRHGNSLNPQLNVTFIIDVSTDKKVISFEDQGNGFDWQSVMSNELPNEEQTSGRGIFLIKEYGYNISYNKVGNKLNLVEI